MRGEPRSEAFMTHAMDLWAADRRRRPEHPLDARQGQILTRPSAEEAILFVHPLWQAMGSPPEDMHTSGAHRHGSRHCGNNRKRHDHAQRTVACSGELRGIIVRFACAGTFVRVGVSARTA